MKLIDKYVLLNVLVPLVYCLLAFLMLFIIFDLFSNLSDFIEAGTPLPSILRFYLYLLPSVLIFIVPISILLGVLYGLSQLTRNNELTAMRASGVSLYRLVAPLIALGFIASLLVAGINEFIAPWSAYWTDQFVQAETYDGEISFYTSQDLPYRDPGDNRVWMIGEFDRQTYEMERVEVIQQRDDGSDAIRYQARKAHWLDGQWWFQEVAIQELDENGYPMGAPRMRSRREMVEFSETPATFINVTKDPQFLSSRELLQFIEAHQHVSSSALARYEVDLHYRLAMPWTCLIVTLLGLPIGAHSGRKCAFLGIALALGLFFSFYVLINFGMALGKQETLPPWTSVWLPNLLYLGIGLISVRRMR